MRVKVWKGHSEDESWAAQVRIEQMIPGNCLSLAPALVLER